jgi:hypothetical protein
MDFYPVNKSSCFTILLNPNICLEGEWVVALKECSYQNTIFNITENSNVIAVEYNYGDVFKRELKKDLRE